MQDFRGADSINQQRAVTAGMSKGSGFQEIQEYRLVVQPGLEVCARIADDMQFLKQHFPELALRKPSVLLAQFQARESMEDTLIRWIQRVCSTQAGFIVSVNNYGGFPTKGIYLRIQDHQPLAVLNKKLEVIDEYIQSSGYPGVCWVSRHRIDITGPLPLEKYEALVREYAPKIFHESFLAAEIALMKRDENGWKLVNLFRLRQEVN